MKDRQTYLKYIGELGNMGFLNYEDYEKIKNKINNRFDSLGRK